jgi:hypothetical protein
MFTQLVTLSDGSTYTQRTTSPLPIYRSSKDTRNHYLWQPSVDSLRNIEKDEAGRLKAFRSRFGRGWDLEGLEEKTGTEAVKPGEDGAAKLAEKGPEAKVVEEEEGEASLMDLISGGVYSKSYREAKDALKNAAALNTGGKWNSKRGKRGGK